MLVREVHKLLTEHNAWLDEVDIGLGELIPEKISRGLENTTHFVLFWSIAASRSKWVQVEMNAAFVAYCSEKCNILVFPLDQTELPLILQPFKYETIDASDTLTAASNIFKQINEITSKSSAQSLFVNRTREIGDIEDAKNSGKRLILLSGISGIGKYSLALRAIEWLYSDRKPITIDLNFARGIPELCLKLAAQLEIEIIDDLSCPDVQNTYLMRLLEVASSRKVILVLRNAKSWLNDNGTPDKALTQIFEPVLSTALFSDAPVFVTSTRFILLPTDVTHITYSHCVRLGALEEKHISAIVHNNLTKRFIEENYDGEKNLALARSLHGYPLAARISANLLVTHGYDYFLNQPLYIKSLTTGLARELISYNKFSNGCDVFLKLLALTKCALRNDEINDAFPNTSLENISKIAEEAYYAGVVYFEDGRYILEDIVQGIYFDAAFEDKARKDIVRHLVNFVMSKLPQNVNDNSGRYVRLLPCAIFLLTLDGQLGRATRLRRDMLATMLTSAWAQYKHREYDEAKSTALAILDECENDRDSYEEARRIQALCLLREEQYTQVKEILEKLREEFGNRYSYEYIHGRMDKIQEQYNPAIKHFLSALHMNKQHMSSMREIAECYYRLGDTSTALDYIKRANRIDQGNPYIAILESKILAESGKIDESLAVLDNPALKGANMSSIYFQKGRIYDRSGDTTEACRYYKLAVELNPSEIDARLCLLNHSVVTELNCGSEIDYLKKIIRGKKLRVLINIEARYIGYINNDPEKALALLDNVNVMQRDRQWYAVRIQLLTRMKDTDLAYDRRLLADDKQKEITQVIATYEKLFKENFDSVRAIIPEV